MRLVVKLFANSKESAPSLQVFFRKQGKPEPLLSTFQPREREQLGGAAGHIRLSNFFNSKSSNYVPGFSLPALMPKISLHSAFWCEPMTLHNVKLKSGEQLKTQRFNSSTVLPKFIRFLQVITEVATVSAKE